MATSENPAAGTAACGRFHPASSSGNPFTPPRPHGCPRPVRLPSSESASANPMLMPAPSDAARPTRNASCGCGAWHTRRRTPAPGWKPNRPLIPAARLDDRDTNSRRLAWSSWALGLTRRDCPSRAPRRDSGETAPPAPDRQAVAVWLHPACAPRRVRNRTARRDLHRRHSCARTESRRSGLVSHTDLRSSIPRTSCRRIKGI